MKGYGQGYTQFQLCQLIYSGNYAAGGQAYIPLTYIFALWGRNNPDKYHSVIKIVQGLAYSHHNNVAYPFADILFCGVNLPQNFSGSQVPDFSVLCGSAECAPHSASYLAGHTYTVPVLIAHKYGFYAVFVRQLIKVFYRTVF